MASFYRISSATKPRSTESHGSKRRWPRSLDRGQPGESVLAIAGARGYGTVTDFASERGLSMLRLSATAVKYEKS